MGTYLSQVTDKPAIKPPRIAIHGKGGVGKTTFAASIPGVLFLPLEDGLGKLQVAHLPQPETYVEVMNAIAELANEKHDYRALAIDTIDHFEPMVWAAVCEKRSEGAKQFESIEDFGYQKGYIYADQLWIKFFEALDALRAKGMTTIVLCHNETKTVEDPMVGPYDRMSPKLHKRANALLYEWSDICGYLDVEKAAFKRKGARGREMDTARVLGGRILYLEDMGGFVAKNRYTLPASIKVPKDNSYQSLRVELMNALGIGENKEAA